MSPEVPIGEAMSSYQNISNQQSPLDVSYSHSINTIPSVRGDYIISEDLLAGQRPYGRMSNVRRFFCLFVTFDFLFVSLLWLICVMLNGENVVKALSEQILHYSIVTSLFDIVLLAFFRFLILIIFYAALYINHWIVIALSTALSCAFLIGKVFMFDWPKSSQPVLEVLLVLASFVLSWGEAWFLDFRVIPQENHANMYLINSTESERAPLVQRFLQGLPSTHTESVANFYSPMASPTGSLYLPESDEIHPALLTLEQKENYKILGARTLQTAWDLYQKSDWKLERVEDQDKVFIRKDPEVGTIFKLETQINSSPKYLMDELYFQVANLALWNSTIKESHKVETIDEYTDITYQISEDGAGGLVSSRDFVNLRHCSFMGDTCIVACAKCEHPKLPQSNKYVRGENGVGCYVFKAIPNEPNKCHFIWIINPNLKISIPKFLLNKELIKTMFVFSQDLKRHISK